MPKNSSRLSSLNRSSQSEGTYNEDGCYGDRCGYLFGSDRQAEVATYYGQEFAGRRTASGETFNPSAMTAAHRTLPFGSRVRVTNSRNGRSIIVRINDRGPFVKGRCIDLSTGAARVLGFSGTAMVSLR